MCNWPNCAELNANLDKADDLSSGCLRFNFDGKSSETVQLQKAIYKLLHTPNEKRKTKHPYVARHHFTPTHRLNHDSTGARFTKPITKEQAESGFLHSQGRIDPILIFEENRDDDVPSPKALFPGELARRKPTPKPVKTVRYIQGPTVPRSAVQDYVDSLTAPRNKRNEALDQRRKENAQKLIESRSVQDWMDEVNTLENKVQKLTLDLAKEKKLNKSLRDELEESKSLLSIKTARLRTVVNAHSRKLQ